MSPLPLAVLSAVRMQPCAVGLTGRPCPWLAGRRNHTYAARCPRCPRRVHLSQHTHTQKPWRQATECLWAARNAPLSCAFAMLRVQSRCMCPPCTRVAWSHWTPDSRPFTPASNSDETMQMLMKVILESGQQQTEVISHADARHSTRQLPHVPPPRLANLCVCMYVCVCV